MAQTELVQYVNILLEKHIPICFCEEKIIKKTIKLFCSKRRSRREILMFIYCIGAGIEEADGLLELFGYSRLYVKIYEDAVWRFALNRTEDLTSVINHIFPQNGDES